MKQFALFVAQTTDHLTQTFMTEEKILTKSGSY